jgi:hypothetical protein
VAVRSRLKQGGMLCLRSRSITNQHEIASGGREGSDRRAAKAVPESGPRLDTSRITNRGGLEEIMSGRTNFAHRIDMWNDDGETIVEQLAGIDDCELAMAAYQFAVERWPKTTITLRQGARVIKDSRKRRMPSR